VSRRARNDGPTERVSLSSLSVPTIPAGSPSPSGRPIVQVGEHPDDYVENGRIYHGFRRGLYMCPCDEVRHAASPAGQDVELTGLCTRRRSRTGWTYSTGPYIFTPAGMSCTDFV